MTRRRREPDPTPTPEPNDPTGDELDPSALPPAKIAALKSRAAVGLPPVKMPARLPQRLGIVLHCTASVRPVSPEHAAERVRKIHRAHTAPRRIVDGKNRGGRGWPDAGYHWVVDAWGNVYQLLGWGLMGRHCKTPAPSLNLSTHGIVLLGHGLETTEAERAAVRWLVEDAERRFGKQWVIGHGEVSSKDCPGPAGRELVKALGRPR